MDNKNNNLSLMDILGITSKVIYQVSKIPFCEGIEIEKVIFSPPATIVFWSDETKTVVKCNGEKFDKEKGLAMAIAKKTLGNKGSYYEVFKEWIPEEEDLYKSGKKYLKNGESYTVDEWEELFTEGGF